MNRNHSKAAFIVLSLLALVISAWLVWHQLLITSGLQQGSSFCSFNTLFDCDEVSRSRFSTIFGIPLAAYGFAFYSIVLAMVTGIIGNINKGSAGDAANLRFFFGAIAFAISLVYALISSFVIGVVCLMCAILYLVAIVLFLRAWFDRDRTQSPGSAFSNGLRVFISSFDLRRSGFDLPLALAFIVVALSIPGWLEASVLKPRIDQIRQARMNPTFVDNWRSAPAVSIPITTDGPTRDFILGPADAPITIVEFSDFECPHCQVASQWVEEILEKYGSQIRFVFKNFPLDQACNRMVQRELHRFACHASQLARCAGKNSDDQFWTTVHALFALGTGFSDSSLDSLPNELGLPSDSIRECVRSGVELEAVKRDIEQGIAIQIQSTPSFFVNQKLVQGPLPETLHQVIDSILVQKNKN